MTLNEINNKEEKHNKAFKKWIENSPSFHLSASQSMDLYLYVESLNREIADLESDKYRKTPEFLAIPLNEGLKTNHLATQ